MRDPGPPVVAPGVFERSGDPWASWEAAHVEPGETLIAEVADAGAEDGAGAELHVEEPWPRYDALSAADVVDRLPAQDAAALSVLLLYERGHRARKTVLDAAERELAGRS